MLYIVSLFSLTLATRLSDIQYSALPYCDQLTTTTTTTTSVLITTRTNSATAISTVGASNYPTTASSAKATEVPLNAKSSGTRIASSIVSYLIFALV